MNNCSNSEYRFLTRSLRIEGPSSIKKNYWIFKKFWWEKSPGPDTLNFFSLAQVPNFEANFCRKLPHYLSSSLKVRLRFNFDILNHFRLLLLLFIIIVKMQFFVITERSKILITYKRPARNVYGKIKVTWPEKKAVCRLFKLWLSLRQPLFFTWSYFMSG